MSEQQSDVKITVRIPHDVAEAMRRLAERNDRSLNGEIVRALREHVRRQHREP
jgi:hypothetical protein